MKNEQMTDEQFVEFVRHNTKLVRATLQESFQFWKRVSAWFDRANPEIAWAGMMAFGKQANNLGNQFDEIFKIISAEQSK